MDISLMNILSCKLCTLILMLRLARQLIGSQTVLMRRPAFHFSKFNIISELDTANILALVNQVETPRSTFFEKLRTITPSRLYEPFDMFTREMLFYLSDDLGLGLGLGIVCFTILFRLPFAINQLKVLMGTMKFEQRTPEITVINEKIKAASRMRDGDLQRVLMKKLNGIRRMCGIKNSAILFGVLQIPIFITVFLSLRHVSLLPEVYPAVKTQGLLWFKDLSVYDPYFILPVASAVMTYWSISLSNRRAPNAMQSPMMQFFRLYSRFFPLIGLPFMMWFNAGMNLYFCSVSFSILVTALFSRSKFVQNRIGLLPEQNITPEKFVRAYVVEQPKEKVQNTEKEASQLKEGVKKPAEKQSQATSGNQRVQVLTNKPQKKPKK